jgi:hypothetical protein
MLHVRVGRSERRLVARSSMRRRTVRRTVLISIVATALRTPHPSRSRLPSGEIVRGCAYARSRIEKRALRSGTTRGTSPG